MSDTVTWAVLGDGTYVKILVNNGSGRRLAPLRTGDFEHSSDLSYEMITGKQLHGADNTEKRSYFDLLADFLSQQHEMKSFDRLIIAAPANVIKELRKALPEPVNMLIVGELAEDLLPKPDNQIEHILSDKIIEGGSKNP